MHVSDKYSSEVAQRERKELASCSAVPARRIAPGFEEERALSRRSWLLSISRPPRGGSLLLSNDRRRPALSPARFLPLVSVLFFSFVTGPQRRALSRKRRHFNTTHAAVGDNTYPSLARRPIIRERLARDAPTHVFAQSAKYRFHDSTEPGRLSRIYGSFVPGEATKGRVYRTRKKRGDKKGASVGLW